MAGSLSRLQRDILGLLAALEPRWTLTGGGALAGLYLGHRITRDLDLFWHDHTQLPDVNEVVRRLETAGLSVYRLRTSPAFAQLSVSSADETTVVDLVADAVPVVRPPAEIPWGETSILADVPYEILVNKLCALLSRAEYRDLVDLQALLDTGESLDDALRDAESKDGGFSAATLAWVLKGMPLRALGQAAGASEADIAARLEFRDQLVPLLVEKSRPTIP